MRFWIAGRFGASWARTWRARRKSAGPAKVERLRELAGGAPVRQVEIDRDEACRRIRRLVSNDSARRDACELGLGRYFNES